MKDEKGFYRWKNRWTDRQTDICDCRVALTTEKLQSRKQAKMLKHYE